MTTPEQSPNLRGSFDAPASLSDELIAERRQEALGELSPLRQLAKAVIDDFRALPDYFKALDPSLLPRDEAQVSAVWQRYETWIDEHQPSDEDVPAYLEFQLVLTPLLVDAGFHDPDYIDDVANDWMDQDLGWAEEAGLADLALRYKRKIYELNKLLPPESRSPQVQMALRLEDVFTQDECADLACKDNPYAVTEHALNLLAERGVEDPESVLIQHDVSAFRADK